MDVWEYSQNNLFVDFLDDKEQPNNVVLICRLVLLLQIWNLNSSAEYRSHYGEVSFQQIEPSRCIRGARQVTLGHVSLGALLCVFVDV